MGRKLGTKFSRGRSHRFDRDTRNAILLARREGVPQGVVKRALAAEKRPKMEGEPLELRDQFPDPRRQSPALYPATADAYLEAHPDDYRNWVRAFRKRAEEPLGRFALRAMENYQGKPGRPEREDDGAAGKEKRPTYADIKQAILRMEKKRASAKRRSAPVVFHCWEGSGEERRQKTFSLDEPPERVVEDFVRWARKG